MGRSMGGWWVGGSVGPWVGGSVGPFAHLVSVEILEGVPPKISIHTFDLKKRCPQELLHLKLVAEDVGLVKLINWLERHVLVVVG